MQRPNNTDAPIVPPIVPLTNQELAGKLTIWLGIFTTLTLFHAAEIAITRGD